MKVWMRKMASLLLALGMLMGIMPACAQADETTIVLSDAGVMVNGAAISQSKEDAVYAANDIVYYPQGKGFTFGEGTGQDAHAQEEADAHTVVHIAAPGTYRLSGELSAGQIAVDLGKDAKKDESAVVTLILDSVSITSTVAPAVIFYNVYECGSDDVDTATKDVDTSAAGANVIIADGSVNTLNGSYVARIYDPETVELSEDGKEVASAKKLHKYDGTLYSKRSMNVKGEEKGNGVLNIHAENEGLCSDLHLTIDGGVINIVSGNDGINASEDNVSVCAINSGEVNIIVSGTTGEGDGIDSNGWLLLGGGKVNASACSFSGDAGIDSDMGIHITGGEVAAGGNMLDHIADSVQPYAVFQFASRMKGGTKVTLKDESGAIAGEYAPENDYMYLIVSGENLAPGTYTLWQGDVQLAGSMSEMMGMMPPMGGFGAQPPEGFDPDMMTPPEGMEHPDGMEKPDGTKRPEDFDPAAMTPPEMPEGFDSSKMTPPEGMEMPEGFDPGMKDGFGGGRGFGGRGAQETGEVSTAFVIGAKGTTFANVAAAQE